VGILRTIIPFVCFCFVSSLGTGTIALADDAGTVKVKLYATIVQGAKPLKDDRISWSISPLGKDGTPTQQMTKAAPEVQLIPGRYRFTAKLEYATATREITVSETAKYELPLEAGWARFQMVPNRKAKPLEESVQWQIYRYSKAGVDEKRKLVELVAPSVQLTLPPGWYSVRAKYQGIVSDMVAEVKAGTLYKYTVVAYAGKVRFAAVDAAGKALKKDVVWTIERVSKSQGGKRVPVTVDQTAAPNLMIGEGQYVAVAKSGNLVGETAFDIEATREKKVTVKLKQVNTAAAAGGG
jgi:hypothetical protein